MKSSFLLCTFDRCCGVIRYSKVACKIHYYRLQHFSCVNLIIKECVICFAMFHYHSPPLYLLSIIRRPKSTVIMEIRLNQYLLDILCLISCLTRHTTEPRTNIEKVVQSCLYSKGCCFSRNSISNSSSVDGVASKENEVVLEQDTTRSQTFFFSSKQSMPKALVANGIPPI